ncbi:ATP-binding cassette domain-containing protein [Lysinibacillus xylanilyticus]|uniref:ABC transporter ATP-binding protein n=1 Tax=Lysinibacillus xylanilyticus TaxID=582475 RepID=UPI003812DCA6
MIKVEGLYHKYKIRIEEEEWKRKIKYFFKPRYKSVDALQNINFTIREGEIVGYIGPNGSGKSTTIKLLTGLMEPTTGKVLINNENPFQKRKRIAQYTGVLMGQKTNLWWDLPLYESFKILRKIYNVETESNYLWVKNLISLLKIDYLEQPVRQLSLGQRMRAELVAAFINEPKLVYLDEPTLGLDVNTKKIVMDFLIQINKDSNTTIMLTTHDLHDIEKVCERIILIDHGILKYDGKTSLFLSDYKCFRRVLITGNNKNINLNMPKSFKEIDKRINAVEYLFNFNDYNDEQVKNLVSKLDSDATLIFNELDLESILKNNLEVPSYD